MDKNVIYNVKVNGFSIGMTFSYKEAKDWFDRSPSPLSSKEICPVKYVASIV